MTTQEIANRIAGLIDEQAAAIAGNEFERLEALTSETTSLLQALDARVSALDQHGRAELVAILQPAAARSDDLIDETSNSLGEARRELQDLRHGQSATSAYRQAVPKEAAISYSRQG